MTTDTVPVRAADSLKPRFNPWMVVPLLYFMQAIPVTLVQDVAALIYKTMGVANEPITRWTSLVAIPWGLQLLLGPIVDLNSTKRKWTIKGQFAIALCLAVVPFAFQMPHPFEISLGIFFLTAIFSTLCNIATDGYYLLTMSKTDQARFAGVLTTSSRVGTLFCSGLLVWIAGKAAEGGMNQALAWSLVLGIVAIIYALGWVINKNTLPRPVEDVEAAHDPIETRQNVARTLLVVGMSVSAYFAASAIWRLIAHGASEAFAGNHPFSLFGQNWILNLEGWRLTGEGAYLGFSTGVNALTAEMIQLAACLPLTVIGYVYAKRTIVGTRTGEAFLSFFRQSKIVPILLFLMFYRFGEAMVVKMAPLFLKDPIEKGGMGLTTAEIGTIKGIIGIFGIVAGGLLGGWIVSKYGLRRTFWTLAILMHLPNLLYLWVAATHPVKWTIYGVHFTEQFGYGFGYAGYMIYQMFVAQRGSFRTTHYAIGVGLGALFIQIAGITSGVVQANFGYVGFFIVVIACSVPGLLTLLFIPLEKDGGAAPA